LYGSDINVSYIRGAEQQGLECHAAGLNLIVGNW